MLKILMSKLIYKIIGKPVNEAIEPIIELLENPLLSSLSAFKQQKAVRSYDENIDKNNAKRLFKLSDELISRLLDKQDSRA
jgi:hypothetical protein